MPKISQLPSVTPADADALPVVQSGVTSRALLSAVRTLFQSVANTAGKATQRDTDGSVDVGAVNLDTAASPTGQEGQIRWNATDKCAEVVQDGGVVVQVGQEVTVRARNVTGSALANGTPVYVTGATGNRPTVAKADADTLIHAETLIGLVTDTAGIANNADGHVTVFGMVRDLDTSSYAEGAILYLSDGTAGTLTTTKPTAASSFIVRVGYVTRSHVSQGVILVSPAYLGSVTGNNVFGATSQANARTALGLGTLATQSTVVASQISDSTSVGRAVVTAATQAEARTALDSPKTDLSDAPSQTVLAQFSPPNALRRAWSKLYDIAQGSASQLRIMVWGDSVAWPKPQFIIGNLQATYGVAGLISDPTVTPSAGARTANGTTAPYDFTISPNGNYAETNGTGEILWTNGNGGVLSNTIKIFYGTGPGFGTFKVQTAVDAGAFSDEAGFTNVSASAASFGLGCITLSKAQARYRLRVIGLTGNVRFPTPLFRSTAISGIEVYRVDRGGIALSEMLTTPSAVSTIFSEVLPDIIFFEMKDPVAGFEANLSSLVSLVTAASPNSRWAFVASTPVATGDSDQVAQNVVVKAQARAIGAFCFDAYAFAGSYAALVSDGLILDGTHPVSAFQALAAQAMAYEMGVLYPIPRLSSGVPVTSGTSGAAPRSILPGVGGPQAWLDGVSDEPALRLFRTTGTSAQYNETRIRNSSGRLMVSSSGTNGTTGETTTLDVASFGGPFGLYQMAFRGATGVNGAIQFPGTRNDGFEGLGWDDGGALYRDSSDRLVYIGAGVRLFGASGPIDAAGTGSPEGVLSAPVGSTFRRTDGGASTTLYVKESGTGNTGWVAK